MKTLISHLDRNTLKTVFAFALLIVGVPMLVRYLVATNLGFRVLIGENLDAMGFDLANPEVLGLFALRLSALGGFGVVVFVGLVAIYQRRLEILFPLFLVSLSFATRLNITIFTFYVDSASFSTTLNQTSILLIVCLAILYLKEKQWIYRVLRSWVALPFLILALTGLFTQIYHLGFRAGLGIVYVRVIQPFIFVLLASYWASSRTKLGTLFVIAIMASLAGIGLRVSSPTMIDEATGRVFAIGSWTIYGTILVATIPLVICLWATTRRFWVKVLLVGIMTMLVWEALLTGTRGAILAFLTFGLFVFTRETRGLFLIGGMVGLIVFGVLGEETVIEFSGGRLLTLDPQTMLNDANAAVRFWRNSLALDYILTHPFEGLGLGKPTGASAWEIVFWTYNPYLAWGVPFGIFGLIGFAILMLQSAMRAVRIFLHAQSDTRIYQLTIGICLLVWVVNQFTTGDSMTYIQSVESTFFFYLIIGMIVGQDIALEDARIPEKLQLRSTGPPAE